MEKTKFYRDRTTWLAYIMLAFFGYFLNVFGPITPFLMDELHLSYTVSSLHTSAFAAGILAIGFIGHKVIARIGRRWALWAGAFGMSASSLLLISVKSPWGTIPASFLMGLTGSLILIIVPSLLSDQHGELRSIALSEANVIASCISALAPLIVGWTATSMLGWRLSLSAVTGLPILLLLLFWKTNMQSSSSTPGTNVNAAFIRLPPAFWIYWSALVLAVSIEFCMIFWSADYLEKVLHMAQASAAQAVSLFLAGMILGRLAGSRLVRKINIETVIISSTVLTLLGFLLYWLSASPIFGLAGLFLTGLGTASLYPLILSLAIGSAGNLSVEAGSRATLASGTAILLLPLLLGRLADAIEIRPAFAIILLLLLGIFFTIRSARKVTRTASATI